MLKILFAASATATTSPYFDVPMHSNTRQAFDKMLKADRKHYVDQDMTLARGLNHVIEFKIGNSHPVTVHLIPDTRLSEITVMSEKCEKCTALDDKISWTPVSEAVEQSSIKIAYFYLLHLFETQVSGSHYKENSCLIGSDSNAHCTTEFYMYSIEEASPLLTIVGDGYLGLGLADAADHGDENGDSYSTLKQL
jgi:hypothetical protein